MVSDPSSAVRTPTYDSGYSTVINALIGAIAGIVLSVVPLSTVLGGAVAGYLEGGERKNGLKVGAMAGLIMLVPFAFIGIAVMLFVLGFGGGGPPFMLGVMAVVILFFGALYTVGLGTVGGYIGVYVKNEL